MLRSIEVLKTPTKNSYCVSIAPTRIRPWRWTGVIGSSRWHPIFRHLGIAVPARRRCSFKSETGESGATSSRSGFPRVSLSGLITRG